MFSLEKWLYTSKRYGKPAFNETHAHERSKRNTIIGERLNRTVTYGVLVTSKPVQA